jgi:hypothetical protein
MGREHPTQLAQYALAGACIFVSDGTCAYLAADAFGVGTAENIANVCSEGAFWHSELLTTVETAAGGGPGLIKAGLGAAGKFGEGVDSVLPQSRLGRAALNARHPLCRLLSQTLSRRLTRSTARTVRAEADG